MTSTVTYQCPNCGAELLFDPDRQKFACEFCFSDFEESELRDNGADARAEEARAAGEAYSAAMNEYACPSCGAEIVSDETTAADICPYCHNPVVLKGRLSGQKQPDRIIPFAYGREEAEKRFLSFAKKKLFVPNDFFSHAHAEKIRGIYYPFWITDADTDASFSALAENRRVYRRGNVETTEISRFRVEREGEIHFEDIVTAALSEADKTMLEGILPYPSQALAPFSMPYLAGYVAKKRDIERTELSAEVKHRMDGYAREVLKRTVNGYSSVTPGETEVKIKTCHWEYSLLPIWLLTYHKGGKSYTFAMNGYTGKIYGELPISIPKLLLLLAGVAAPLTALFSWIGGMLF